MEEFSYIMTKVVLVMAMMRSGRCRTFNMPPPDSRSLTIGRRTGAKVISVGIGLSIFTRTGIGTAASK